MAQMARLTGRPGPPRVPRALASERTLASVFANPQFANGKAEVTYEYDFGDGWTHEIVYLGKGDGEFAKRQIGKGVVDDQMTWCVGGEVRYPFFLLRGSPAVGRLQILINCVGTAGPSVRGGLRWMGWMEGTQAGFRGRCGCWQ